MNFFNLFKRKNSYDFQFIDKSNLGTYAFAPPILAKELKPLKEYQTKKYDDYLFPRCPGMYEYASAGYIIPAWANLLIKSNKADSAAYVNYDKLDSPYFPRDTSIPSMVANAGVNVHRMDSKIAHGMFEFENSIENAFNFNSPWSVFSRKNIRFLVMPAYYHNPKFNTDIFGYPGIIEYGARGKDFHTLNMILSARKKTECTFAIGEPLIHVIPFEMPEIYTGAYGFANSGEQKFFNNNYSKTIIPQFYRKFFMKKRKYSLEKRPEVQNQEGKFNLKK